MNQRKWLIGTTLTLLVVYVAWYFYSNWGLVTIHAKGQPLSKIVSSIQRQAHVTLKTDLDPATKVSMDVTKVPVAEALETLGVVTESRWSLNYYLAPTKIMLRAGIDTIASGKQPDGWKTISYPIPQMFGPSNGEVRDPRRDDWTVKESTEKNLQAYLDSAAKMANVGFAFPESWNPAVGSAPRSGIVEKVVPKLVRAVNGNAEQIFVLTKSRGRMGMRGDRPEGGPPPDLDWMTDRALAEIKKLPADEQSQAQAELAFWKDVRNLTPEERRAKMQERMNDPAMQDRMENRQAQQDARRTPEQKLQRMQSYVDRKMAAKQ